MWYCSDHGLGHDPKESFNGPSIDFQNFKHPIARSEYLGDAAWTDNRYKLVVRGKGKIRKPELYDLIADPSESNDLASSKAELVSKMLDPLTTWQQSVEKSLTGADY